MNEEDYIERREDREFETMKDQYQEQLNKFSELLQDFAENNLGATDCKECNELCHTIMPLDNKTYEGNLKGLFDSILVLSGNVPHPKEEYDKEDLQTDLDWFEGLEVDKNEAESYIKHLLKCEWVGK